MPRPRTARPASSGWFVHLLAAVCLLATVALGVLAMNTRHSSGDLGFAVLLIWLMPLATFFLGAVFLAMSPRPAVSRVGLWLLGLMLLAAMLQKLFDRH